MNQLSQRIGYFLTTTLMAGMAFATDATTANLPVKDADFGCITQSQAQKYEQDFSIDTRSFGGMELCDSKVDTKKLFNDLRIIEEGSFDSQGKNLFIRGFVDGTKYYSWMKSQTRGIERGNDIPFATAYNSGGYFTMQDGWAVLSTLGRVGTVIHEARHTAGYRHIPCTAGPYMDSRVDGCDTTYEYGGSHAVEMEYYARVSVAGKNFHPLYQSMARMMALGRSNIFFNKSPIQRKMALLASASNGKAWFLRDGKVSNRELPVVAQGALKRTSFGASIFTALQAFALDVYQPTGVSDIASDDYSYFKLLKQDRGQGSDVVDAEEYDIGAKRFFTILNSKSQMNGYDFPNGKWRNFAAAPSSHVQFHTIAPDGTESFYAVGSSGDVYQPNPEMLNQAPRASWSWPSGFKTFAKYEGATLGLDNQGHVVQVKAGQQDQDFALLKGQVVNEMVSVPTYDAFDVQF